jgi:hypothetical protein
MIPNFKGITRLPELERALERRYPGVKVEAFLRDPEKMSAGYTCTFHASRAKVLYDYGLATPAMDGERCGLIAVAAAPEVIGSGSWRDKGAAYVCHHLLDDPVVPSGRAFPLRKTVKEVDRMWRRISTSPRS